MTPKQFATLLRVRRHRRDLIRSALGRILAEGQAIAGRMRDLGADRDEALAALKSGTGAGGVDVDRAAAFRYHALRLSAELGGLSRAATENADRARRARGLLVKADQGVKAVEKLQERFEAARRLEAERRADRDATDRFGAARAFSGATNEGHG